MDSGQSLLVLMVGIISLGIGVLALTNRVIFKMAFRNFARRKAQSAIVISGLMIGTAIISASLVVGDTMRYLFEVDTYHSLGEVDEEIYGTSQYGGTLYFNESVYHSVSENLSSVKGIQSTAPLLIEYVSVSNPRSSLAEPSVRMTGYDSSVMRKTAFGDLDGAGFFPDVLGTGQTAINSRLAEKLDARNGDILTFSFGVANETVPQKTDVVKKNFTIAKIIREMDLYGKANFGMTASAYFELDFVQSLLLRNGQINYILVSNDGDTFGGEYRTADVNRTIQKVLDEAVGMQEMGLSFSLDNGVLELTSANGYFSSEYSRYLFEKARNAGATTMTGTMVMTTSINSTPTPGLMVIGVNSTDPAIPSAGEGELYIFTDHAVRLGIFNGTQVPVVTMGMDGLSRSINLTAVVLLPFMTASLSPEIRNMSLGFVGPATVQTMLIGGTYKSDMYTFVQISGIDNSTLEVIRGTVSGYLNTSIAGNDVNIKLYDVKYDNLKTSRASGESIGQIFMIFSVFSIIAGIALIINIFIMLAEERKSEMGMARAVGMLRRHLVRMFLFEGTIYVFIASAVGAFVGLGLGRLLIVAFAFIFQNAGGGDFPFFFTWESVLTAFCMGVLLTFVTIYFASRRAARLNIIRAIRKIPEPRGVRAMRGDLVMGVISVVFGILFTLYAYASTSGWAWMAGPCLLFLGCGIVAYKFVSLRLAISPACIAILVWIFNPVKIPVVQEAMEKSAVGLDLFVISGLFLVLSSVLLIMFNSDLLLGALQKTAGKAKSTRAVLKISISYPMHSKMKTGLTLGMFALIIFTVTVIAMIASMQSAMMGNMYAQQSGGYQIMGYTNSRTPFENLSKDTLPGSLQGVDIRQLETLAPAYIKIDAYDRKGAASSGYGPAMMQVTMTRLMGVSDTFLQDNGFSLKYRDRNYTSDRDAWQTLGGNSSLCIIDGSRLESGGISAGPPSGEGAGAYVGGTVTISDISGQNKTRTLRIIGITHQQYFLNGIFVSKTMAKNEYGALDTLLLVKLGPGENSDAVTKNFKKAYTDQGLQAIDIKAMVELITRISSNIMYLMEGFLGIGLMVGIAGIGIISYRNVIERRQQIGMMRAIGFQKRMITRIFINEISFITVLATLTGLVLGIGIGYQIFDSGFRVLGASFVIPWANLLVITLLAYFATLLFTFYPAIQASKIPPADALRYIE